MCPWCEAEQPSAERFCPACAMPLVLAGDAASAEAPESEAHARARKIRPEYARGDLVRVAGGRNQAEAELIHGFLLEEGIPSLVRRAAGFDVPDFLAAGQRDVLVPESGAGAARELLSEAEVAAGSSDRSPEPKGDGRRPSAPHAARLVAAIFGGGLVTAGVAWLLARAGS
ncbi:hypothetical protein BH24ACT24_BH24ACT24_06440 [soil metagenome]